MPTTAVSEFPTADEAVLDCARAIFETEKTQASNLQLLITSISLLNQKLSEVAESTEKLANSIDEQQRDLKKLLASNNATAEQSDARLQAIFVSQSELQRTVNDSLTELQYSNSIMQSLQDALSSGALRLVIQAE